MSDYQCTCPEFLPEWVREKKGWEDLKEGCILHDPKLKGYLMVCQRLDKLIQLQSPPVSIPYPLPTDAKA